MENLPENDRRKPLSTLELQGLRALFIQELKCLYGAMEVFGKVLPRLTHDAYAVSLTHLIKDYHHLNKLHIKQCKEIFGLLHVRPQGGMCTSLPALLSKIDKLEGDDAAIVVSTQKLVHYELGLLGSLHPISKILGMEAFAFLLSEILHELQEIQQHLLELMEDVIDF